METFFTVFKKCTLFSFLIMGSSIVSAQYVVNFEGPGEIKTSYAAANVNLSGIDWNLTEALIGTESTDWKNGARSARLRGYGASSMTMLADKSGGVGTITFKYRRYGTDFQVDWKVEYSTDGGTTWTQAGSSFTAPDDDVVQTFSAIVNQPGNVRIRIKRATENGAANRRLNVDDIEITDYSAVVPTLSVSPTSLSGFEYLINEGPSTPQSFTVSGTNLTGIITVSSPLAYEVSLNSSSGYTSTLDLTPTNSTLDATTIYIRLKAGLPANAYHQTVNVTSSGATPQTVNCQGMVTRFRLVNFDDASKWVQGSVSLSSYATNHTYTDYEGQLVATGGPALRNSTFAQDGFPGALGTYSWRLRDDENVDWRITITSGGVGQFKLKIRRWDGSPSPNYSLQYSIDEGSTWTNVDIINNTTLNNSSDWKQFTGTINSSVDNIIIRLKANGTTERIMIDDFEWEDYAEICTAPDIVSSGISFSSVTTTSATINFTKGNGSRRLAIIRSSFAVTVAPVNNTTYLASSIFGEGQEIAPEQFVVYNGTSNTFNLSGLTPGTDYYLAIYEYRCSHGNETYATTGATFNFSTAVAPVTNLKLTCTTPNTATLQWTNPVGNFEGVVIGIRQGTLDAHTLTVNPGVINASSTFGLGYEYGSTTPYSYVVYKGTGNTVTVTFPDPTAPFKVKTYAYRGTTWSATQPTLTISKFGVPDVTNLMATAKNASVEIGWTNPSAGCFDEVIIVAHTSSINDIPSGTYEANSLNFTDPLNPSFPSGGKVVYNGVAFPQTVTGLINGQTYYFKIFVRRDINWSEGVQTVAVPDNVTILDYADLAILGINTNINGSYDDELIFTMFKDFTPNSTLDFTDNGYEREVANYWGTTEGVVRLKRKNTTLPAGTVVTVQGKNLTFNVYANGSNDNANWEISQLGSGAGFDLNVEDQIWFMQGGVWDATQGTHRGVYTGKILFGWTATGWQSSPGYASTKGSTRYPGSECSSTNVSSTINKDKVKYTGPTTAATRRQWIGRINNPENWTGYPSNTDYFAANPFGSSLIILPSSETGDEWIGDDNLEWANCRNWGNLRVPRAESRVVIPSSALNSVEITQPGAQCYSLVIKPGTSVTLKNSATLQVETTLENESGATFTQQSGELILRGDFSNHGTFTQSDGKVTLKGDLHQTIHSDNPLVLKQLELDNIHGATFNTAVNVSDNLILKQGPYIPLGNFVLGQSAAQPGTLTYTGGHIAGTFRRWFSASVNSGNSGLMPIGVDNKFRGLRVEFTAPLAAGGILSAAYQTTLPANYFQYDTLTVDGIVLNNLSTEGVWVIEPENGLIPNTYTLSLTADGLVGANNPLRIRILKRTNNVDKGSNYNGAWANGSNGGKGFGPWLLTVDGANSGYFIGSSNAFGHANIGESFGLFGHSGQWASAQRSITSWGNKFVFSFDMAVQLRDQSKGIILFNQGGFAPENEIWNFNISNDGYGTTGWSYRPDMFLRFRIKQNGNNLHIQIIGQSPSTAWRDTVNYTILTQTLGGFRFYTGGASSNQGQHNLYFNNLVVAGPWEMKGTFNYADGYYSQSGIDGFSEFTLAGNSSENPLPVDLLYFDAYLTYHNMVQLKWGTATEYNSSYFTVDRSFDARSWTLVGVVGAAGNSLTPRHYDLTDSLPLKQVTYYRLKQTDYDGKWKYLKMATVGGIRFNESQLSLYPNPSIGILAINGVSSIAKLTIFTLYGKKMAVYNLHPGENSIDISNLPNGVYLVAIEGYEGFTTRKIVLNKP